MYKAKFWDYAILSVLLAVATITAFYFLMWICSFGLFSMMGVELLAYFIGLTLGFELLLPIFAKDDVNYILNS